MVNLRILPEVYGEHLVAVLELHAEHAALQHLFDRCRRLRSDLRETIQLRGRGTRAAAQPPARTIPAALRGSTGLRFGAPYPGLQASHRVPPSGHAQPCSCQASSLPSLRSRRHLRMRRPSAYDSRTTATRTTIGVSWNSDSAADNQVAYGTSADALTTTFVVPAANTSAMPGAARHRVLGAPDGAVAGHHLLLPRGRARLALPRAGGGAAVLHHRRATTRAIRCASWCSATTAPTPTPARQASPICYEGIIDESLDFSPQLFVNTGDMVKNGDVPEEWDAMIRASEATWSRIPSITTQGNHDTGDPDGDGALYNRLYELPRNSATDTEDYYAIDIGPIHFVSLNTQHLDATELRRDGRLARGRSGVPPRSRGAWRSSTRPSTRAATTSPAKRRTPTATWASSTACSRPSSTPTTSTWC